MKTEIAGHQYRGWEVVAWSILLGMLHAPWLFGGHALDVAYLPQPVAAGQWWRVATYPFVHVSWYHLLLDGVAFLFLWQGLRGSLASRMGTLVASATGGLIFAALGSTEFWAVGLCGLSGVAHGLMARQALDLSVDGGSTVDRRIAGGLLVAVVGKCLIEAVTGAAFFGRWHFGALGTPIVICHLGGVCGALVWWVGERVSFRRESRSGCIVVAAHICSAQEPAEIGGPSAPPMIASTAPQASRRLESPLRSG